MSVEFIDELPPYKDNPRHRGHELRQFADVLRANPGRWAKWPLPIAESSAHTNATRIRKAGTASFPPGEFDAAVRDGALYVQAKGR